MGNVYCTSSSTFELSLYIEHLRQWVEIPSISCQADTRPEVFRQLELSMKQFQEAGAECRMVDNPCGMQVTPDGEEIPYPPIIPGTYPKVFDPKKKTILLYGH